MPTFAELLSPLDPSSTQPLYQQLQRAIREAIENRVLSPDDALPAERQIATELEISRITVRKALDGLVDEGLLVRHARVRAISSPHASKELRQAHLVSEDMRAVAASQPQACG